METNSGDFLRRPESALKEVKVILCVFFLISLLNLEEASTLSLHVRFRVGSDRP